MAGAIDMCRGLGERFLALGYDTPFLRVASTYQYPTLSDAQAAVRACGAMVATSGLPRRWGPLAVAITGDGNVSQGVQEVLRLLPHRYVTTDELQQLAASAEWDAHVVYLCQVTCEDMVCRRGAARSDCTERFSFDHYLSHPEEYQSIFDETVAPFVSVIFNCIYWESRFPRLLSLDQMQSLHSAGRLQRLLAVCDISCDADGSLQFLQEGRFTSIEAPFAVYDVREDRVIHNMDHPEGFVYQAVDHLPAECPYDASNHFSAALLPYLQPYCHGTVVPPEIAGAIIAEDGRLTPRFAYITQLREEGATTEASLHLPRAAPRVMRRILLLGAGMVTPPLVDFLLRRPENAITVASRSLAKAEQLCRSRGSAFQNRLRSLALDAADTDSGALELERLIPDQDLIISMIPASLHHLVASRAIRHGVNVLTSSYVSPQMAELDAEARAKGVTVLNEVGVDPGMDHISACRTIHEAHAAGWAVQEFKSVCGGLPAPDAANLLGYKFSWSPRGLLVAARAPARHIAGGSAREVDARFLMAHAAPFRLTGNPALALEFIPNRDSSKYAELYGVPEARGFFRGTLRFEGFCRTLLAFAASGLMDATGTIAEMVPGDSTVLARSPDEDGGRHCDNKEPARTLSLPRWLALRLGLPTNSSLGAIEEAVTQSTQAYLREGGFPPYSADEVARILTAFRWLGYLRQDGIITVPLSASPVDVTAAVLIEHPDMQYKPDERDMIVMQHEFTLVRADVAPNGERPKVVRRTSTLQVYGDPGRPGYTAMASTVGKTTAIAAQLMLDGTIARPGILRPLSPAIFMPIMENLEEEGFRFQETEV